jgi:uncharacterized protein YkwD
LLVVVIGTFAVPAHSDAASVPSRTRAMRDLPSLDHTVLQQLNRIRRLHGLAALRESNALDASAAEHSRQMGLLGYFHHSSADGTSFWQRIANWYPANGFAKWSVGENMLWWSPGVGAARIAQMWMASPPHRSNILDPNWRQVGISATHFPSAPGVYGGRPATIVTTDFGVRS